MRPGGTTPSAKGPGIHLNDIRAGYYRRRLVKNGPLVPAQIFLVDGDRDPETGELMSDQVWRCQLWDDHGPRDEDAWEQWSFLCGDPITKQEFDTMVATFNWARGTSAPEGSPTKAIDYLKSPAIF